MKNQKDELPKNWEVIKLGDILLTSPEYGANESAIAFSDKTYRYLRITDIDEDGNLIEKNKVGITKEKGENYLLEQNDIIIARTGNTVGKSYMYKEKDGVCAFAGYLIKFVLDKNKYHPKLLFRGYVINGVSKIL